MIVFAIRTLSGNLIYSIGYKSFCRDCVRFVRGGFVAISLFPVVACFGAAPSSAQESDANGTATYLSLPASSDGTPAAATPTGGSVGNSPFRYVDGQKAPDAGYARPGDAAREEIELAVEQLRRRQTELEDRIEALERRLGPSAPSGSAR